MTLNLSTLYGSVGPANSDIAAAVAAPSASAIATAVAAPSASTIASAVTTAGNSAGWGAVGSGALNYSLVSNVSTASVSGGVFTITGLNSYKKIKIVLNAFVFAAPQQLGFYLNGNNSGAVHNMAASHSLNNTSSPIPYGFVASNQIWLGNSTQQNNVAVITMDTTTNIVEFNFWNSNTMFGTGVGTISGYSSISSLTIFNGAGGGTNSSSLPIYVFGAN